MQPGALTPSRKEKPHITSQHSELYCARFTLPVTLNHRGHLSFLHLTFECNLKTYGINTSNKPKPIIYHLEKDVKCRKTGADIMSEYKVQLTQKLIQLWLQHCKVRFRPITFLGIGFSSLAFRVTM